MSAEVKMAVRVIPDSFSTVSFDAEEIRDTVEGLIVDIGLPQGLDVIVEVDQMSPLGISELRNVDPVHLLVHSGAFEDAKRPRHLSRTGVADLVGRYLFQVKDRLDPGFGAPPIDEELDTSLRVAWDAYAVGRLTRLGYRNQRQRRLYHFRNRHGFNDVSDASFARLWDGEDLKWSDIVALSEEARKGAA